MTTLIAIWLAVGFFSYWPLVYAYKLQANGFWYEWIAAWILYTITWPYHYAQDAWYWWRAKK